MEIGDIASIVTIVAVVVGAAWTVRSEQAKNREYTDRRDRELLAKFTGEVEKLRGEVGEVRSLKQVRELIDQRCNQIERRFATGGTAVGREITVRIDRAPKVVLIDPKPGVCHGGAG